MLYDNPKTINLSSDPYCITINFIIRQLYLTIQSPLEQRDIHTKCKPQSGGGAPKRARWWSTQCVGKPAQSCPTKTLCGFRVGGSATLLPALPRDAMWALYTQIQWRLRQLNRSASVLWALLKGYLSMQDGVRYTFDIEVHLGQWDEVQNMNYSRIAGRSRTTIPLIHYVLE